VTSSVFDQLIRVYLSDSTGALHASKTYPMLAQVYQVLVEDWNQDGRPDLIALTSSLQILYGRGDGTFDDPVDCGIGLPSSNDPSVVLSDFNHDRYLDLAFSSGQDVDVLLGAGACRFAPMVQYQVRGGSYLLRGGDMNGDGQIDLVALASGTALAALSGNPDAGYESTAVLTVLLGSSDGTFTAQEPPILLGSAPVAGMALGEVTGDGRPDVLVIGTDGQTVLVENTCQ
jgi:FG-GAP-like repeat